PIAQRGYAPVPAVGDHGGVVARGPIVRDVTLNLVALRRLRSKTNQAALQKYILALALVAATEPMDGFLRAGCLLVPDPEQPATWEEVERTGVRTAVPLSNEGARTFADAMAKEFGVKPRREANFD